MMIDFPQEIIDRCRKNDAYLKTLRTALVFDEDDIENFENTYNEILDELIAENQAIHGMAERLSKENFKHIGGKFTH